jgi:hypothetical protein
MIEAQRRRTTLPYYSIIRRRCAIEFPARMDRSIIWPLGVWRLYRVHRQRYPQSLRRVAYRSAKNLFHAWVWGYVEIPLLKDLE